MKEDKLNKLFEGIRRENPETSPDQVAAWLNSPPVPPSSSPDLITNAFFTSKNLVIMSIIISAVIATIVIFIPGKSVEIPNTPEINIPISNPIPDSGNITSEIATPPTSEISPEINIEPSTTPAPDIQTRKSVEVPNLMTPAIATLNPDSKTPLQIKPMEFLSSHPNSPAAQIKVDTLFSGVQTVELNCTSCQNVRFMSHQNDKVRFKGDIINSDSDKQQTRPSFSFEKIGNTLIVTYKPSDKKINFSINSPKIVVDILFEIPEQVNIKSNLTYGNIVVDGIRNDFCSMNVSSGNVSINNADSKFEISSTYGHQNYQNIIGTLNISSASGNIDMVNIKGDMVIKNTYGKIDVANIVGDADIKGSSSNISAHTIKGNLNLVTTYGNIHIEKVIGDVDTKASSGNITVDQLKGDLKTANTYGKLLFTNILGDVMSSGSSSSFKLNTVQGNIKINTTYGNVLLESTLGNVDITASNGNVDGVKVTLTELMNITLTYGNIKMNLNNQAADLSYNLNTSSGNIKIKSLGIESKKSLTQGTGPIRINATTKSGNQVFE